MAERMAGAASGPRKKRVRGAPAAPLAPEQKEGGLWKGIGNPEVDAFYHLSLRPEKMHILCHSASPC
jgi:hypothetical protein